MFNVDIRIYGDKLTVVPRLFTSKLTTTLYVHCYPGLCDPSLQQLLWKVSVLGNAQFEHGDDHTVKDRKSALHCTQANRLAY